MENEKLISKQQEVILKNLKKAISIVILLENDLEISNSDGVGATAISVVHDILNDVKADFTDMFT